MTTYTTRNEAIEALIITPLENSGEETIFFNIEAIATETIDSNEEGYFQSVSEDEFWDSAMRNAYDVITYTAGRASTSSDSPVAKGYVEAFNRGEGETYLAHTGARVEEIPAIDSEASYERIIPATTLSAAHGAVLAAEAHLAQVRAERDDLIREYVEGGMTMYAVAKEIGLTPMAIGKIVKC